MDGMEEIIDAAVWVVDQMTFAYRMSYERLPRDVSLVESALAVWAFGSLFTFFTLALFGLAWDFALRAIRGQLRTLLYVAAQGADLDKVRELAAWYVGTDWTMGAIQRLSGVVGYFRPIRAPDPIQRPSLWSRAAQLGIALQGLPGFLLRLVRTILTTIWGLASLAATWWALGKTGGAGLAEEITRWWEKGPGSIEPWVLTAIGVGIAASTFVLSRMRDFRTAGYQAWRRDEATRAADELADRAVAISALIHATRGAGSGVYAAWAGLLSDAERQGKLAIDDQVSDLEEALAVAQGRGPRVTLNVRRGIMHPSHVTPHERAIQDMGHGIEVFRQHLKGESDRQSVRVVKSLPLNVARRVTARRMGVSVQELSSFARLPKVENSRRVSTRIFCNALVRDHLDLGFAQDVPEDFNLMEIPLERRLRALRDAKSEWESALSDEMNRLNRDAHDAVVAGAIGLAELENAHAVIQQFLYPAGTTSRLREWLLR